MQTQFFRQCHIHRDIGGGRTGKEGIHATFTQAGKHQRERVAADLRPHNNRVDHQSDKQHTAEQYGQQLHITGKRFKTGFRNGRRHQAENTQRRKTDNPFHNGRNGIGQIGRHLAGRIRTVMAQSRAQYQSPSQNADIVGIGQRVNRVGHQIHQQRFQHFDNAGRRRNGYITGRTQNQRGRECHTGNDCHHSRSKRTENIQNQNRFDVGLIAFLVLRNGGSHQNKYQNRRDSLKRTDKQAAQQSCADTDLRRNCAHKNT